MGGQCSKQTESKEKTEQKIVTSLGSHEVKALTEMFRAMDADHNGTVSWEEMLAMAENREHKASEEVVASLREMFDQMDTNHDGRVNLQEYITFQEAEHDRRLAELDASQKENAFDENKANTQMDRYSRAIAALGVDTMQNMMSLKVLVIGLTGVGIETAKDLILAGPQAVTVHDDDTTQLADLGTNFYLKLDHVESKAKRGPACVPALSELNPYVTVSAHEGALTTEFLHTFGAVIVSKHLPKAELFRINQACRSRQLNGVAAPVSFILALTYGASFFLFSDFGDAHLITDYNGESVDSQIVQSIDELGGVHVAGDAHDLDDGDRVKLSEIEGATFLNDLESIPVKRIYSKVADLDGDGKQKTDSKGNPKWRSVNVQKTFQLDFSDNKEILEKFRAEETKWTGGGIINYVKPQKTVNYKSLEATLNNPLNDQNFFVQHLDDERTYSGRGNQLHLAFAALLDFEEKHNRFPVLHSQEDAKEMVAVATAVNTARGSSEGMVVDSLDADVITMFSLYAATELSGSCAFLGGAVAQEVVKKFGKYTPLNQWLTVDYFELLPGGTTVPADAAPIGSRYDHQIAIFGKAIQDKILAQKWFLVGCGALGCEYIKAFAMMGIGASPEGKVHITDLDTIELSNLSRQFLFRSEHINKFKSESAAVVAKQMNPDMNLQCHVTKVCDETEHIFDDAFWNGLDGVWNALDNIHARHYTDGKCVIYGKPLIESGTEGTKANSSVHIPHQTLTYSDTPVQETGKIAACTLRNFPHLDVHCIEWARPRFESLFAHGPQQVNTLCSDEKKFFETLRKEPAHDGIATLKELIALMTEAKGRDFASAARLAATEFTTQFRNRIKDLIYCFPEDARSTKLMEDGTKLDTGPFWGGKKRFPSACELDLSNDTHFNFMHSATNLFLFVFGQAPVDAATFRTQIASVDLSLPDWVAPTEVMSMWVVADFSVQKDLCMCIYLYLTLLVCCASACIFLFFLDCRCI
jgi:ubiquitin-activating enzyme E1